MRAYLLTRTGGYSGWQRDLVERSGVKRQTISKWTNPAFDGYPDPDALAEVARALDVRPFEIVAAIDGDVAVSVSDPRTKEAMRDLLEELLAERDARRPRRMPPEGDASA